MIDDDSFVLPVTSGGYQTKNPAAFISKLQKNGDTVTEIAGFIIDNKATSLVTDNDTIGMQGTELIAAIVDLNPKWAKRMSFVLNTGQPDLAKPAFDALNAKLTALGYKKAVLLPKPAMAEAIQAAVEESWIQ